MHLSLASVLAFLLVSLGDLFLIRVVLGCRVVFEALVPAPAQYFCALNLGLGRVSGAS